MHTWKQRAAVSLFTRIVSASGRDSHVLVASCYLSSVPLESPSTASSCCHNDPSSHHLVGDVGDASGVHAMPFNATHHKGTGSSLKCDSLPKSPFTPIMYYSPTPSSEVCRAESILEAADFHKDRKESCFLTNLNRKIFRHCAHGQEGLQS